MKRAEIPKPGGRERRLGIPTVPDRFIQQAVTHWEKVAVDSFPDHRHHDAADHYEGAIAFCRKAGYRPEPAAITLTCCKRGTVTETGAKAVSVLDESLAISSDLGMRPLMDRVLSRREILKA